MPYVANARMYSVNQAAASAWRELFGWLARESGVDLHVIDHAFPLPLAELWSRPDLACVFMCGFPYALAAQRPRPVAAPVPAKALVAGRAVYATRLLVRADSNFRSIQDTFGGRLGYTIEDSHSGYNVLRHHFLPYRKPHGERLYRESIGPLFTPRRVIRGPPRWRYRRRSARQLCAGPDAASRTGSSGARSGSSRPRTSPRFRFSSPPRAVPTTSCRRCRPRSRPLAMRPHARS